MKLKIIFLLLGLLLTAVVLAEPVTLENEKLILTIDETNLDVSVTDKASGLTLYSGVNADGTGANKSWTGFLASTLVLDVASGTAVTTKTYDIHSSGAKIDLKAEGTGAEAVVDFTDAGQRITVRINLKDDGFTISVPRDGIEEYGETMICGLYLLPAFGATQLDDQEGYLFVPEAAGAIINFSNGEGIGSTPFSKRVYGRNIGTEKSVLTELNRPAEQITMPVYGLTHMEEGIGYLAVIEAGDESSEIMAYPAGVITKFNWAAAHFILREQYIAQTTRSLGLNKREAKADLRDLSVGFHILTGEDATYAGMARRYRRSLEENGLLKKADCVYRPCLTFLGAESARFLLWNSVEPMTDTEQAAEALAAYEEAGVRSPLVIFKGWQKGGLTYAYGSGSVSPESKVGSKKDLTALSRTVSERGGVFLIETDPVLANPDRMYNMRVDIVRTIGQMVAESKTGKDLYPSLYYLTPPQSAKYLKKLEKEWAEGVDGFALSTMPNVLYSYYSNGSNHKRSEVVSSYASAMAEMTLPLALENPIAPYYGQTDYYMDLPLGTTGYSFLSAEVPFLPMVLSGEMPYYCQDLNFESNQRKALLKLVEYGAYPSWTITGNDVQKLLKTNSADIFTAQWEVLLPTVQKVDAELNKLQSIVGGLSMTNHEIIDADVVCATYENGVEVFVNYRNAEYSADGLLIPAQSWIVREGGSGE
ncbi:MAG: hypothetical protein II879_04170 [Clostridia bacterium]|nr:hypothetical protein [Clostridia bacterium]